MILALNIAIVILAIGLIVACVIIRNLLIQNDKLEEAIQLYSNRIEETENETIKYYNYFLELFTKTHAELARIDKRGSFSSDDEVGFAFKVVLSSIETVKEKLRSIKEEEESDSEKRK